MRRWTSSLQTETSLAPPRARRRYDAAGAHDAVAVASAAAAAVDDCHARLRAAVDAVSPAALEDSIEVSASLPHEGSLTGKARALLSRVRALEAKAATARWTLDRDAAMRWVASESSSVKYANEDTRACVAYLGLGAEAFYKAFALAALEAEKDRLAVEAFSRLHADCYFPNPAAAAKRRDLDLSLSPAIRAPAEFAGVRFSDPATRPARSVPSAEEARD